MRASLLFLAFAATLPACSDKGGDTAGTDTSDSGTDTSDSGTDTTDSSADSCVTDICATYGAAVPTVAGQITDAAAVDAEFAPFFADLVAGGEPGISEFKTSLANFISDAYGCSTGLYTGPDMTTAHTGMAITQAQYDDFVGLIAGILADDGVAADDITYCFAPVLTDPAFSSTIVGK